MQPDRESLKGFSRKGRKAFEQAWLLQEFTELLSKAMEEQGLSGADVAKKIGKSRAYVSKLLGGGENVTLKTAAGVAFDLDRAVELKLGLLDVRAEKRGRRS